MPTEAFHVSTKVYVKNQVIAVGVGANTEFHGRLVEGGATQAETRLEASRPAAAQSRLTTQYAFADPYNCLNYGMSQHKDQELHFYRVSMENPARVPMALVDIIKKVEGATPQQIEALVAEYWSPTQPWEVYEHLASSMTILEKLPTPADEMQLFGATFSYQNDIQRANAICATILAGQALPAVPR